MRLFYEQWTILDNFSDEKKILETFNLADASSKISKIAILEHKQNRLGKKGTSQITLFYIIRINQFFWLFLIL